MPVIIQTWWVNEETVAAVIRAALEEDLGRGDLTTLATVPAEARARARLVARQEAVLAGLPYFERVFRTLDPEIRFDAASVEGAVVRPGEEVARIEGRARAILSAERTALNILTHLSGIATLTRRHAEAIAGTRARLRDTRKTLPGLRVLEKYAVLVGGGTNHRMGLFDAILIKENHIALAGSLAEALRRAQASAASAGVQPEMTAYESYRAPEPSGKAPIEVEVRDETELREALAAGAEAVLLDNIVPSEAARLIALIRRERPECLVEVSGRVDLSNIRAYAEAGADFIAVGALTHSAPAADFSLLVEPLPLK